GLSDWQGVVRRRWQSDAGRGHGGSVPEVPATGAQRAVRRIRQRHAGFHGRQGGYGVQEPQRGTRQEKEVSRDSEFRGGERRFPAPPPCCVISSSIFSCPFWSSLCCARSCVVFSKPDAT